MKLSRIHTLYSSLILVVLFGSLGVAQDIGDVSTPNLKVFPESSVTGAETVHNIEWTAESTYPLRAQFAIYYDKSFDLNGLVMAASKDQDTMEGGLEIKADTLIGDWKKVVLERKGRDTNVDSSSLVGIQLAMVGNPDPGDYKFRLWVHEAGTPLEDILADVDTTVLDSGYTNITIYEQMQSFDLSVINPANIRAGEAFELAVTNAVTADGESADGIVNVAFQTGTLDDHKAPNGQKPVLVPILVNNGSGSAFQTLYKVEYNVVLQGTSEGVVQNATDVTNAFNVRPGALGEFELLGYPDTTKAGTDFTASTWVTVRTLDFWGNLKTDFAGDVYFESSTDTAAVFFYDAAQPDPWPSIQGGEKSYSGEDFELNTAGLQTFSVVHDTIKETSDKILVIANVIDYYELDTPANPIAGESFQLSVNNAVDKNRNPASGTVSISISSGSIEAPNGQRALLNDINVVDGSGTASQTLVRAEDQVILQGRTVKGVLANTNEFTVNPNQLNEFRISGYPQTIVVGDIFPNAVRVTALDRFENPKTDFYGTLQFNSTDTSADLPADSLINNQAIVDFPGSDFIFRSQGDHTISVQTGQIADTTDTIEVTGPQNISIPRISSTYASVSQDQQQVAVTMEVKNEGSTDFSTSSANLTFTQGGTSVAGDYDIVSPSLGTIPAGQTVPLTFQVDVRPTATLGDVKIDGNISGTFGTDPASASQAVLPHTWTVQQQAQLTAQSLTAEADTLAQSSGDTLRLVLTNRLNSSNVANAPVDDISFRFQDANLVDRTSSFSVTPLAGNPTNVAGGDSSVFLFRFSSIDTATGTFTVSARVTYQDANIRETKTLNTLNTVEDNFVVVPPPKLEILSVDPSQPTVTAGQEADFQVVVRVQNIGNNPVQINLLPENSFIKFYKDRQEVVFDVSQPNGLGSGNSSIPAGGVDSLIFTANRTVDVVGVYIIRAQVQTQDGFRAKSNENNADGLLTVQEAEDVMITNVYPSQPSVTQAPGSDWYIVVGLFNGGGSDVQIEYGSTSLTFTNEFGDNVTTSYGLDIPDLAGMDDILRAGESDSLIIPVTTTGDTGTITIDANVGYSVLNSGAVNSVRASDPQFNKEASVLVQSPADFSIVEVKSALDSVSQGQSTQWDVFVTIQNQGGADVAIDFTQDSTWLQFAPLGGFTIESRPTALFGSGMSRLPGFTTDSLRYRVSSSSANTGKYDIKAAVKAVEENRNLVLSDETINDRFDTLRVVGRADVYYVDNTLSPDRISASYDSVRFTLQVENRGDANVVLDPARSTFIFKDTNNNNLFTAMLDPLGNRKILGQNSATLRFVAPNFPASIPVGAYTPIVEIRGSENGSERFAENLSEAGDAMDAVQVVDAGEIAIQQLRSERSSVTQEQTFSPGNPWTIEIDVKNNTLETLRLDSVTVEFYSFQSNRYVTGFNYDPVSQFLNASPDLGSDSTGTLEINIASVPETAPTGPYALRSQVVMRDSLDTRYEDTINQNIKTIVQTPAQPSFESLNASQASVTLGQDSSWTVTAIVRNAGQSALRLDPDPTYTFLNFSTGSFVWVAADTFLASGSDTLTNTTDSLLFTITQVPRNPSLPESIDLSASVKLTEINTSQDTTVDLQNALNILLQKPANPKIDSLEVFADSNFVNAGGEFYLRARVTNDNDNAEMIERALVRFESPTPDFVFLDSTASVDSIASQSSRWTSAVRVQAPDSSGVDGWLSALVDSVFSFNTGGPIQFVSASTRDSIQVQTQAPGALDLSVDIAQDTVNAGYKDEWNISVTATNSGEGAIELLPPQPADIQFLNQIGDPEDDWVVQPDSIAAVDRRLAADSAVTITYVVERTGETDGLKTVQLALSAKDLNNTYVDSLLTTTASDTIFVQNIATVKIFATETTGRPLDTGGFAVNRGQNFDVEVKVETSPVKGVDSVLVELTSSGNSIDTLRYTITTINAGETASAVFPIQADNSWDENDGELLETFTATITEAFEKGGIREITPDTPDEGDGQARVFIQTPAQLSFDLRLQAGGTQVGLAETFTVDATFRNSGRAPMGSGRLALRVPTGYGIETSPGNFDAVVDTLDFTGPGADSTTISFNVRAPNAMTAPEFIVATLDSIPRDRNSEAPVIVDNDTATVEIETVESYMSIESFVIVDPDGAMDGTLSTEQEFTVQAVVHSTNNLADRQAILGFPGIQTSSPYERIDPESNTLSINSASDTLSWRIRAPGAAVQEIHEFNLTVGSRDNPERDSRTLSINQVQRRTTLYFDEFTTNPEGIMQNGEAYFTKGQEAVLRIRVRNNGVAPYDSGVVTLNRQSSGITFRDGDTEQKIFKDDSFIEWKINIPSPPGERIDSIRVEMSEIPNDQNTNKAARVIDESSVLKITIRDGGGITVDSMYVKRDTESASELLKEVSTEQRFRIGAWIQLENIKAEDRFATLSFDSARVFQIVGDPEIILPPNQNTLRQEWTVIAPQTPRSDLNATITVRGKDLRSESNIRTDASIPVPVVERTKFIVEPWISVPEGRDRTERKLSTGQLFTFQSKIRWDSTTARYMNNDEDSVIITIVTPPTDLDFDVIHNPQQSSSIRDIEAGRFPEWTIKVPDNSSDELQNFSFDVVELPRDRNSGEQAIFKQSPYGISNVQIVERAKVKVLPLIGDSEIDTSNTPSVRPGHTFTIGAKLNNEGEADPIGAFGCKLEWLADTTQMNLVPDSTFQLQDDEWQTAESDSMITWQITAPSYNLTGKFRITLDSLPKDEFSGMPVELLAGGDTTLFEIDVRPDTVIVSEYPVARNTGVVLGASNVEMMGLTLQHQNNRTDVSELKALRLSVRDHENSPITPTDIVTRIAAVHPTDTTLIYGEVTSFFNPDSIILTFEPSIEIQGGSPDSVRLEVDILENVPDDKRKDFRLTIDSISALTIEDDQAMPLAVVMRDSLENTVTSLSSKVAVLIDGDLNNSFYTYPNPFNPANTKASFLYYLKEESDVKIHIYTLTGELVKVFDITKSQDADGSQTGPGLRQGGIKWDGKNGVGKYVVNGVYLAYISTEYGEQAMTKIVVVR